MAQLAGVGQDGGTQPNYPSIWTILYYRKKKNDLPTFLRIEGMNRYCFLHTARKFFSRSWILSDSPQSQRRRRIGGEVERGRPTGVRSPSCADARCENATTADDADVVAATVESENSKCVTEIPNSRCLSDIIKYLWKFIWHVTLCDKN